MLKDAHPVMSTSGTREQSVRVAIFPSGSGERLNFVNHAKIKRLLVIFQPCFRTRSFMKLCLTASRIFPISLIYNLRIIFEKNSKKN